MPSLNRSVIVLMMGLVACGEPAQEPDPPKPLAPVEEIAEGPGAIQATAGKWAWVPFSQSRCMNGSSTGIGVNLSATSDKVLLFLDGGGACFNDTSCTSMVANIHGFDKAAFQERAAAQSSTGIFDRNNTDNPFRDWSFVFIPYCSGDVHAGKNPAAPRGLMHLGYVNIGLYLERLVPTFSKASLVVLSGASAGGSGASFNYDRVQQAFGNTPVLLLNDSAPVLGSTWLKPCLEKQFRDTWKLDDVLPADCTDCRGPNGSLFNFVKYTARKYPQRRMGLIVSDADFVFRSFYGFGDSATCVDSQYMSAEDFRAGVADMRAQMAPYPNFRFFSTVSTKHVYLGDTPLGTAKVDGTTLTDWLRALVSGGSGWDSNVVATP